jgi:hypothetical protein
MKEYVGMDVYIHVFLTLALGGDEWSASRSGRFTPGERAPGTNWIGGWVDLRAGLDTLEKILDPTETQTLTSRPSSPLPAAIPTALSRLQLHAHARIKKHLQTQRLRITIHYLLLLILLVPLSEVAYNTITYIFNITSPKEQGCELWTDILSNQAYSIFL